MYFEIALPFLVKLKSNKNKLLNEQETPLGKKKKRNNSCFGKCVWPEKSSPGRPQIFFFNRFSEDILFSFFSFFCSFWFLFCLFVSCSLKLRNVLIHIRLSRWVSDKNIFTRPISKNKTTLFFELTIIFGFFPDEVKTLVTFLKLKTKFRHCNVFMSSMSEYVHT